MEAIEDKTRNRRSYSFVLAYLVIYLTSAAIVYLYDRKIPLDVGWLWLITGIVVVVTLLWTRNWKDRPPAAKASPTDLAAIVAYTILYILATSLFWNQFFGRSILVYQLVTLWLLLVATPALIVKLLKKKLPELGFTNGAWKKGLLLGIVVSLVVSPLLVALSPLGSLLVAGKLPATLLLAFPAVLVFALITAAFQEEFFFRGILQEHAEGLFQSEANAIAFTVIFFSLFHFPFVFANAGIQSKGLTLRSCSDFSKQGLQRNCFWHTLVANKKHGCAGLRARLDQRPPKSDPVQNVIIDPLRWRPSYICASLHVGIPVWAKPLLARIESG